MPNEQGYFEENVFPLRVAKIEDTLKDGDGGGTSGGMESRIARLESDMGHVKDTLKSLDTRSEGVRKDVGEIKTDLATLKANVGHLPGKGFIFAVAAGLLASAGALMTAVVRFIPHAAG